MFQHVLTVSVWLLFLMGSMDLMEIGDWPPPIQREAAADYGHSRLLSALRWLECVFKALLRSPVDLPLLPLADQPLVLSLPKPCRLRLASQGHGKDIGVERKRDSQSMLILCLSVSPHSSSCPSIVELQSHTLGPPPKGRETK